MYDTIYYHPMVCYNGRKSVSLIVLAVYVAEAQKMRRYALKSQVKDMTVGNPFRLIFSFSLPIMAGNIIKNLYTIVDAAIVGQGCGINALAAIGSTDWAYWLMLWFLFGFAQSGGVITAQYFGAGYQRRLRESASTALRLSFAVGAFFSVMGIVLAGSILEILGTQKSMFRDAHVYLMIVYSGNVASVMYDTQSAIIRALGDSKNPFIAQLLAGIMNMGLDMLFVFKFRWGVAGAAVATVMSQAFAAGYCWFIIRRIEILRWRPGEAKWDKECAKRLMRIGMPLGVQYSVICVGGMMVQSVLNRLGAVYVAAYTAATKLHGLFESICSAFASAVNTFVGQNFGARCFRRIKRGVNYALVIALVLSALMAVILLTWGKPMLGIFIDKSDMNASQVLDVSYYYLALMSIFIIVLFLIHIYRSALVALGSTLWPVCSGICELIARGVGSAVMPVMFGTMGIFWVEMLAWWVALAQLSSCYYIYSTRLFKKSLTKETAPSIELDD